MKAVLGLLAATFVLPACGGRASLDESYSKRFRQAFQQQADSSPSKRPANLTASDAKVVVGNHEKLYSKGKTGGSRSVGSSSPGGGGSLDPLTASMDEGGGGSGNKIQLKAK